MKNVVYINDFSALVVSDGLKHLFGKYNWYCIEREACSEKYFQRMKWVAGFIQRKYRTVVINKGNFHMQSERAVLYAPNHIRTVDPIVIETIVKTNIHWVALKRFFDGEDSIFNNSKNPILCWVTKYIFKKLSFFPIERKRDNENANNVRSIKDMSFFLKNGFDVGIFPEGTTRKTKGNFWGEIDPSFVELAKRNNALIQPILIFWTEKRRPIVDFGRIIETQERSNDEIYREYIQIQQNALSECMNYATEKCVGNKDKDNPPVVD